MSIPEASQLVLQAAAMGESGRIYVLDMGKPIRIAELARDIIRLSGLNEETVRIEYTGLRPGEKLFEEVIDAEERLIETPHPKFQIAEARPVPAQQVMTLMHEIATTAAVSDQLHANYWRAGCRSSHRSADAMRLAAQSKSKAKPCLRLREICLTVTYVFPRIASQVRMQYMDRRRGSTSMAGLFAHRADNRIRLD